jgi:FAD/FMN-containing dehydrogenase/Fe-S oxidoreductase
MRPAFDATDTGQAVAATDTKELLAELRRRGVTDADDSTLVRALYSSDASLYRVIPRAVVRPRHVDELDAIVDVARTAQVPLTMRGAGTSIAGNAVGSGLVVDTLKHLNRVLSIDAEARTAMVEPGVVHAQLQRAAAPHGHRFGPDPSTHSRCTIGGMIGNNACGSRALGYGRTSDNVVAVDPIWGADACDVPARLTELVASRLGHVRTAFGHFSRQVSGYSLEHLLPERASLDKFLVGSEGTLAVIRTATVRLVEESPRQLMVLGYPSMAEAADAVPAILSAAGHSQHPRTQPGTRGLIACEGLDARIVDLVRATGAHVPTLPRGAGWLFIEFADSDLLDAITAAAGALESRVVTSAAEAAMLWRIREDGAGLAARSLSRPAHSGWEDAAVPPAHLGAWLRDFEALLQEHGLQGVPYGHFGDGCVHVRIDFEFGDGGARFRRFLTDCATRLREYGGSLSGEHGDGRARSELLPLMYDAHSMTLFAAAKNVCDPNRILNPGVLVEPQPLDASLRPERPRSSVQSALRFAHDTGSMGAAVHRCTGVGKCVTPTLSGTGVMCPSYLATGEEKDSTRGRARVLQEALDGSLVKGLADDAVREALDLCLSCKGCASDCPTGVDMAAYKSETLHQTYAGRRRPLTHYTLGRLPTWARLAAPFATGINRALSWQPAATLARAGAGMDQRRPLPQFAAPTLRRAVAKLEAPDVWIWADTFTNHFLPDRALAAIRVLDASGLRAGVIPASACCGLTWITTGQLGKAKSITTRTIATLAPYVASGTPVVAIEPSCLATLRSDVLELADGPDVASTSAGVLSFAELMDQFDVTIPDLSGLHILAQPHCHQSSVIGWDLDHHLLERAGASVTKVEGCCGLAGNWGVEKGHYDTSLAVARTHLLPAVRSNRGATVLADGMSCRIQLSDLADVEGLHLAEMLSRYLGSATE